MKEKKFCKFCGEKIDKDIQNIKDNINTKLSKIDSIANKINDHNLAIVLTNIAKSMQNYSLQARDIKLNSNKITIAIVSQNTQNINKFEFFTKQNRPNCNKNRCCRRQQSNFITLQIFKSL